MAIAKYINYMKSLSLKWILKKEERRAMMKTIYKTEDHYPNQVLSQTENKPNREGKAKCWIE